MKVLHLSRSDVGGAGRAAYRIHRALLSSGIDSSMWVNHSSSGDWTVKVRLSKYESSIARISTYFAALLGKTLHTNNKIIHSPAIFPSQWLKYINQSDVDVVHLHWVAGEMLSIADIRQIKKPLVWTLHDMWAFCGAEHVSFDRRWRDGYLYNNRPTHESGFDLNRWTWERKRKYWRHPFQIVTPSRWLASCVQKSALMSNWPVNVVPNCIDTDSWKPIDRILARELLGLPQNTFLLMFGANGAGANASFHKGFDLLVDSLKFLKAHTGRLELVVFGQREPQHKPDFGFPVRYVGFLHDDISLRILYSAVDALVVPSRSEAFCQTASEAQSCGTPVVAFRIGGLKDIVSHMKTGYLANPFDSHDLAAGINWTISQDLRTASRQRAERLFSNAIVANQYINCYTNI